MVCERGRCLRQQVSVPNASRARRAGGLALPPRRRLLTASPARDTTPAAFPVKLHHRNSASVGRGGRRRLASAKSRPGRERGGCGSHLRVSLTFVSKFYAGFAGCKLAERRGGSVGPLGGAPRSVLMGTGFGGEEISVFGAPSGGAWSSSAQELPCRCRINCPACAVS